MSEGEVVIVGGGNAVHVLASQTTSFDTTVLLTIPSEYARWHEIYSQDHAIHCYDAQGSLLSSGRPHVTNSASECIPNADFIVLPVPTFAHRDILEIIKPYVKQGAAVIAMPGQGGFDELVKKVLGNSVVVAGLNQLPYQCRIKQFGRSVQLIGHKEKVACATVPAGKNAPLCLLIKELIGFGIQVEPLPSYMAITLAPTNQVIHPSIMYGLFHGREWKVFDEPPLFYQNTDALTASMIDSASAEIQLIAQHYRLPFETTQQLMLNMYGDNIVDKSSTQSIFRTNKGYAGLTAPMVKVEGGYTPDFTHRYITEDIPCLKRIQRMATELKIATPTINTLCEWADTLNVRMQK